MLSHRALNSSIMWRHHLTPFILEKPESYKKPVSSGSLWNTRRFESEWVSTTARLNVQRYLYTRFRAARHSLSLLEIIIGILVTRHTACIFTKINLLSISLTQLHKKTETDVSSRVMSRTGQYKLPTYNPAWNFGGDRLFRAPLVSESESVFGWFRSFTLFFLNCTLTVFSCCTLFFWWNGKYG